MNCEICFAPQKEDLITKCCKLFICEDCRQKYEKAGICICGKQVNKKIGTSNPTLFAILQNFYQNQAPECDRCQKKAEYECRNCKMFYCFQCNNDVHSGKGFAKHFREPYETKSPKKAIERIKNKQEFCTLHSQPFEGVCECGTILCSLCVKSHKEGCKSSKIKPIKEYRQDFFSQILLKIKQITQYKEKLLEDRTEYQKHFEEQKGVYKNYLKTLQDQLEGLKKILQIKGEQLKRNLENYWNQCEIAYRKNLFIIDHHLHKFDDYARLSEKFVEKVTGLEYLQKRIKRINVIYDFFNFRVNCMDDVQNSIVNIDSSCKNWELLQQNLKSGALEQEKPREKKLDLLGNIGQNSQFLLQCSQNPLNHRPLTLVASHNQIFFEFLHLPYHNENYEIQFGVGLKMRGQEVFRKLINKNGRGEIPNLNPSTKYRVRMRVSGGQWGPISEVKTQDIPRFFFENSQLKHTGDQNMHQHMLKPGTVYGSNEIAFGNHVWQIKVFPMKHLQEETACISLGVSNKQTKKPVFVGTTLNYGYQKQQITVKLVLNCQQNRLTITSSTTNQDEIYQNLPNYPIYPMLQNKGNHPVQIQYTFLE